MIYRLERIFRTMRRRLSRSAVSARLLKLPKSPDAEGKPGLVLIQIDGLAFPQFQRALKRGNLPFLRRLLKRERYELHEHYSGIPSTTPAVQGELFYGVKAAVPAFSFRDHRTGRIVRMFEREPAEAVQKELEKSSDGLLVDGSCYADIYSGGAKESHFCAATWGWSALLDAVNPWILAGLAIAHGISLLRIAVLSILEYLLAVADCLRGIIRWRDFWAEIKFVHARVLVAIVVRELLAIGASLDIARGLPVIHLNFLGYDEQAHRRGPSSDFAHWSLKGIDAAIGRIWHQAHRSSLRDYHIWIYSDHGQEDVTPYAVENGRTVQEAVAEVFGELEPTRGATSDERSGIQSERIRWIGGKRIIKRFEGIAPSAMESRGDRVIVAAMGPLGHVYPAAELSDGERERIASRLVVQAKIPQVFAADGPGEAVAWNLDGKFRLPLEAGAVLGADHPFLVEAALDLVRLVHHPDSGALILSGWRPGHPPLSFPLENGAHAGPGANETRGFALLPADAPLLETGRTYLRPSDLREAAISALGRRAPQPAIRPARRSARRETLRIMTYNVHSCLGMDGRISTERIARVIMQSNPDIVALQELDVRRARTGGGDQAHEIAHRLEMEFQFHPALSIEEELYGDAILSRLPMRLIRGAALPGASRREPRGALWVSVDAGGVEFQMINTHLGLRGAERRLQADALLGADWLGHPDCRRPALLVGDFNATPAMDAHRRLTAAGMFDAQRLLDRHRPKSTWFGRYPLIRIDHIFASPGISVVKVEVPRTSLALVASDHLPLIAEVLLKPPE